ncbi:hypothetical protein COEREDRAFT_51625 [Coemansia reversa NRRL 1564]|uniref:P-loop containing nucleoside triphosphate hydrolase protein n=1 Tax=Coemansia reversa (strain ATCC 12441 / NRRL 1564) TaxID=763665 RepID=A0A2G5B0S6_COERN|nr:hypothetical protein COEREDRAFT_51625 [Coemansia reversa NRRL 1564]|eukprot:PIA12622.1 hypothetical protein COEREDRAFT_51625 [Coemansia reversa NRRL 1564]
MDAIKLFKKPSVSITDDLECYGYELTFTNQKFVLSYMHPLLPYRGMLLTYQLGNGKTYAAAALSHLYTTYGFDVLFLSHNLNVKENFKKEYLTFIRNHNLDNNIKKIKRMGLTKFFISKPDINGGLVIIDEAHNLRENANRYPEIKNILDKNKNIKILVITATPMIDSINEIDSLRSLIEPSAPIAYSEKAKNTVKINYIGKEKNFGKIMLSEMKGNQLNTYLKAYKNAHYDVYSEVRQASVTASKHYNNNIPLSEQSAKIQILLDSLIKGELTAVFCFYIKRGINFITSVLLNNGFEQWKPNSMYDENIRRFAIITGKTSEYETSSAISSFNSIMNIEGGVIEVMLGSSVLNESITLKNVRHAHILTPFWNYGQTEQALGRVVRIGSHEMLPRKQRTLNVYLHASHIKNYNKYNDIGKKNVEEIGIDIEMWKTSWRKKEEINNYINRIGKLSIWNGKWNPTCETKIPPVDNKMVIKANNCIWDLNRCFETNRSKISWCNVNLNNAICYNCDSGEITLGPPTYYIKINRPLAEGYTIWRSCVDEKLRLTNNSLKSKNKRCSYRGKLIKNINKDEIIKIADDLNVDHNINAIIENLKKDNRFFDKQIEII